MPQSTFNFGGRKRALFRLWTEEAERAYERLEAELVASIQSMRINGLSEQQIFQRLQTDMKEGIDVFSRYRGDIEGKMDDLLNQTAQLSAVEGFSAGERDWLWQLDPTVQQHCVTCIENNRKGQKDFDFWASIGLPGTGNTECGVYCRCSLEPV